MPAYNFQSKFISKILSGKKAHTIRRRRKNCTNPGSELMLYTGMRTKNCVLIATAKCVNVEPIRLYLDKKQVWIWSPEMPGDLHYDENEEVGGFRLMLPEEVNALAEADGFEDVYDFFDFFKIYKRDYLDDFEIIHWNAKTLEANHASEN